MFTLTLMKGDKVVEMTEAMGYKLLFVVTRERH